MRGNDMAVLGFAFLLGAGIILGGSPALADDAKAPAPNSVEAIKSGQLAQCKTAVSEILRQRGEMIKSLIGLCDESQPQATRAAAMYLLGKMRAVEACQTLVKDTHFSTVEWAGRTLPEIAQAFGVGPARKALEDIGEPSVPYLIDGIKNSADWVIRQECGFAIWHITGAKRGSEMLTEAINKEKDAEAVTRLKEQLAKMDRRIQREDEAPH